MLWDLLRELLHDRKRGIRFQSLEAHHNYALLDGSRIYLSPWLSNLFPGVPPALHGVGLTETTRTTRPEHIGAQRLIERDDRLAGARPLVSASSQNLILWLRVVAVVNVRIRKILNARAKRSRCHRGVPPLGRLLVAAPIRSRQPSTPHLHPCERGTRIAMTAEWSLLEDPMGYR